MNPSEVDQERKRRLELELDKLRQAARAQGYAQWAEPIEDGRGLVQLLKASRKTRAA